MEKVHFAFVHKRLSEVSVKGNNTVLTLNHTMLLSFYLFTVVFLPLKVTGAVKRQEVELGKAVILQCSISLHHEIFWLRVSMHDRPRLLMVAGLKSDGKVSEVWNSNNTHYKGCLHKRFFGLKILHVLQSDLASYYCGTLDGKRMEFEDGVHVYERVQKAENFTGYKKVTSVQPERVWEAKNMISDKKDAVPSMAENGLNLYPIFAAVLCVGQLVMVVAVVTVHLIAWKKNTLKRKPS